LRKSVSVERASLDFPASDSAKPFLVEGAGADAGHEALPHAGFGPQRQRRRAGLPAVEVGDDVDLDGVGRPHREVHAGRSVAYLDVGAELLEAAVVAALGQQVQVEAGQRRGDGT
jgi:hypothetical protein